MNVKELKDVLENLPDDMLVVMSSDAEGNSYSPLSSYDLGMYTADSTYSGEFMSKDSYEDWESSSAKDFGDYDEDKDYTEGYEENALIFWPTN